MELTNNGKATIGFSAALAGLCAYTNTSPHANPDMGTPMRLGPWMEAVMVPLMFLVLWTAIVLIWQGRRSGFFLALLSAVSAIPMYLPGAISRLSLGLNFAAVIYLSTLAAAALVSWYAFKGQGERPGKSAPDFTVR